MTFQTPMLLWLLLLLPLTLWWLRGAARRRASRARAYADDHLLGTVLRSPRSRASRASLPLQLGALTLLLFGAAAPVARPSLPTNKAAVMIALDASRSMLADDVKPTRLEAARQIARDFVRLAPASTRIGFLTFSDTASVLVPPTTDRAALLAALDRVRPAQATSFTGALVSGVRALPERQDVRPPPELQGVAPPVAPGTPPPAVDVANLPPGAILLLSDGISNRGADPLIAAKFASDHKVKLHGIALGKQGGAVSRVEGQLVFVPYDTTVLQRLSSLTDGRFIENPTPDALRELSRELGSVVRWEPGELPLAGPLSGLAALLMIIGGGLALRTQRRVP